MFAWWRQRQREKILEQPFLESWRSIIEHNVASARFLDRDERKRLEDLVQVFVAEKNFEGCGGLELDDEIRVTVAANACVLLLGLDHELYSGVESILIYPSTVRTPEQERSPLDSSVSIVGERPALLGQAHMRGPVILVWDAVARDSRHPTLGHNVVFHEFAHKLDMLDNEIDGTPPLRSSRKYAEWSKACGDVYWELRRKLDKGEATFLGEYAASSEAEFFAVATELFFTKPEPLQGEHPGLYRVLSDFYRQDPASRLATSHMR